MGKPSFFRALAKDPTANTIVIAAATMVPLVAMVGGAVDASRYYMASTRLQAACDAGALAARRAMGDAPSFDSSVHGGVGTDFFEENYSDGLFGLENLTHSFIAPDDDRVEGTASGRLPTTLMHIFGFEGFDLSVGCSAEVNIANTDVMFVLDVTGSMGGASGTPGQTRIQALRAAVLDFYDSVETNSARSAQIRYGFVPFSMNVNVGGAIPVEYMASNHTYPTRYANFDINWERVSLTRNDITDPGTETLDRFLTTAQGFVSETRCEEAVPEFTSGPSETIDESSLDISSGNVTSQTVSGTTRTTIGSNATVEIERRDPNYRYDSNGFCRVGYDIFESTAQVNYTLIEEQVRTFANYTYLDLDTASVPAEATDWQAVDFSSIYTNNQISLPVGDEGAFINVPWAGCIEEANTDSVGAFDPITDATPDLDINLIPANDDEAWKPLLPSAVYYRYTDGTNEINAGNRVLGQQTSVENKRQPSNVCPAPARRLEEIGPDSPTGFTRGNLVTYLNSLQPSGNTYHDIGMIWGGRFISPNGIFAADNRAAPNGDAIARHIVYMTDGILQPFDRLYTTYGLEWWQRRVTDDGSIAQQTERHAARFQAVCQAARQENVTVWAIGFGDNIDPDDPDDVTVQDLTSCASPNRAYFPQDGASLADTFAEIAEEIAALRLTS